jgi:hypothetical protein
VAVSVALGNTPPLTVVAKKFACALPLAGTFTIAGEKIGVMFVVSPAESTPWLVTTALRVTGPAKFALLVTVMVETTEPPLGIESAPGTARTAKSKGGIVRATEVE